MYLKYCDAKFFSGQDISLFHWAGTWKVLYSVIYLPEWPSNPRNSEAYDYEHRDANPFPFKNLKLVKKSLKSYFNRYFGTSEAADQKKKLNSDKNLKTGISVNKSTVKRFFPFFFLMVDGRTISKQIIIIEVWKPDSFYGGRTIRFTGWGYEVDVTVDFCLLLISIPSRIRIFSHHLHGAFFFFFFFFLRKGKNDFFFLETSYPLTFYPGNLMVHP